MIEPNTAVLLRADGDTNIGLGHVHRLLALCEVLKGSFMCIFVIRAPLPGVRELIQKRCDEIIEIDPQTEHLNELSGIATGKEIIVVDGYRFDTAYQQKIKLTGAPLVCIDDIHHYHFISDIIINPSGGIDETVYSKNVSTRLFSGPQFSLLKQPFLRASQNRIAREAVDKIFICMGGSDPDNHTIETLRHCLKHNFSTYFIVVGEAYPYRSQLESYASKQNQDIKILSNLEPGTLVEIMKQCAVAVCSASGIAYEYLSVGGELYIKKTATNQADLFNYLLSSKLAFVNDAFRANTLDVTASYIKQREIFDGKSDLRILKIFTQLDFDYNFSARRANIDDIQKTFEWANDSSVRALSFNSQQISSEDHATWFEKKIKDPNVFFFIFEYKNTPVGQVRFDIKDEAIISYLIDPSFRGRGLGQLIVKSAIEKFSKEVQLAVKIIGYVKQENYSSNTIFKNLGFTQHTTTEYTKSYKYELIDYDRN